MRRGLLAVTVVCALAGALVWTAPSRAAGRYQVPAAKFGAKPSCDIPIRMSDGVRLFADVVTPDVVGKYPTILTITGYNKSPARYGSCSTADNAFVGQGPYVAQGYNRIVVDDRGTGNSEGSWDSWGERMQQDYKEVLDWIVAQPWSNGSVGLTGASYMGITSFLAAETLHPAVKAIWADVPMADAYRDVTLHGGNIDSGFIPLWLGLVGGLGAPPPSWSFTDPQAALTTMASHASGSAEFQGGSTASFATNGDRAYDGPFYRLRSPETKAANLHIPVAWTGGWFDLFQRGEPRLYNALSGLDATQKKWFQSPTYHAAGDDHWDELGLGPKDAVVLAWFDHWLKGVNNGIESIPSISTWAMGANRWEHPASWPVPGTRWTSLWLDGQKAGSASSLNDGSLSSVGGFSAGADQVPLGSVNGVCSRSTTQWTAGLVLAGTPCETDNRLSEATALTYTTATLPADLQVTGPLTATIWATLDRPDATFVALVSDVAPDGTSSQVTGGWLNASHRALDPARTLTADGQTIVPYHPFTKEAQQPAPTGKAAEYQIEVFPTSQVFKTGHRLRLTIATGELPHITAPAPVAASELGGTATILHDAAHPSRLLVPVVGTSAAPATVLGNTVTAPAPAAAAPAAGPPGDLPATGAPQTAAWLGVGLLFAGAAGVFVRRRYSAE